MKMILWRRQQTGANTSFAPTADSGQGLVGAIFMIAPARDNNKGEDKLRPYGRQRLGFCRGDPCDRPREEKQ